MGGYAWVTLATNDAYSLGALVLAHSLRRVGTTHDLVCMVTPGVTPAMREKLAAVFSMVQEVNVLDSKDEANLALLARPELGITFTKLHCWRLTQYEKCVFIDADALVVRNCDELFEREELSAAPDVGWPDCFNSGVFVFRPSQQTFASITAFAAAKGSFDGGDQGLLNMYFSDWATKEISKHLPFIYNMCSTATYSYLPAFKQFGEDVRIIHFIGITKPWLQYFDTLTGIVQPPEGSGHLQPLLQLWWNIFCEQVHPQLSASMAGIAGALAQITLGEARSAEQTAFEDQMRKQSWEQGQIDYMGRDSFENIWKKIMETLSQAPQQTPPKEDIPKAEERATTDAKPVEQIALSADVVPAVEPDKDPTQGQLLACKTPEEKSSAQIMIARESGDGAVTIAQSPEPKTITSPTEKAPAVEAVATKVSGESPQPPSATQEDVCMKPSQDVMPCEASMGVPAPQPLPMEPSSVAQMSAEQQCKLATPMTQETPSQDKSGSTKPEEPAAAPQQAAFASLLTEQAVCALQKPIAPVTQTDDGTPTESKAPLQLPAADKPQIPAPVVPDITQPAVAPISIDSPGSVAVPFAVPGEPTPGEPVQDSAKLATESKIDVTQPLAIDPGERCAEMLLAASEVSTVSPVPIQVAESVLQTEPKEAVSGAAVAASDQAIATTITAVHEPAAVAPAESEMRTIQMNGSTCDVGKPISDIAAVTAAIPSSPEKLIAAIELTKEPAGDSATTKDMPLEISPVPSVLPIFEEKIISSSSAAPLETSSEKAEKLAKPAEQIAETGKEETIAQIAKTESTETKPPEQIAKTETIEGKSAEQVAIAGITETIAKPGTIEAKTEAAVKPTESIEQALKTEAAIEAKTKAAKSPDEVPKSPVAEQKPPSEPLEAKALDIPSTPTVIEATPPTSPSVESAQEAQEGQDKAAKKSLKKSDSADGTDGEGADKKTGKKSAKKVTKKPKSSKPEETAAPTMETVAVTTTATAPTTATATVAGAGADSSQGKTKKTVKVTKKTGAKTGQSLETDTAIPETPPPPTPTSATATTATVAPDVPVPPKRKTKTTTSGKGTTGKKPETEE